VVFFRLTLQFVDLVCCRFVVFMLVVAFTLDGFGYLGSVFLFLFLSVRTFTQVL